MKKEENILLAQISALDKNLERVKLLLAKEEVKLGAPVSGKFFKVINPRKTKLAELKLKVEGKPLNQAQLKSEWEEFLLIRQEVQKIYHQCLEYIGGIAVRKWKLENNICDLAEKLVSQYVELGASWLSVTIVGEERLFDTIAQTTQIIRLRFPDWDIWSLPFTAYEFGRWIAGEEGGVEGLRKFFTNEKERLIQLITISDVTKLINTSVITENDIEGGEIKDLAPEINSMRQAFQAGEQKVEAVGQKIDQQEFYMKELFADAFATYFLGPAYPYARVYLRLDPSVAFQDGLHDPSPARRMDLMLRLLEKMGDRAARSGQADQYEHNIYKPEQERLKNLWESTIKAIQPGYEAKFNFGIPFNAWVENLYTVLASTYSDDGFTGKNWEEAKKLGQQFEKGDEPPINLSTPFPVILNAAWYCRVRKSDLTDKVAKHVRKAMLDVLEKQGSSTQAETRTGPGNQTVSGR